MAKLNLKTIGFTLIELLIAISIIGILSTLILTNLHDARVRARDTQRKNDLHQVKTSLRMYYNDNQAYPNNDGSGNISGFPWGSQFGTTTVYMKKLPEDPASGNSYYYAKIGDDSFYLFACLENKSDKDGINCTLPGCSSVVCFIVSED